MYQGGLSLSASAVATGFSLEMIAALTASGGILILRIGLRLLELIEIRVANLLPLSCWPPAWSRPCERSDDGTDNDDGPRIKMSLFSLPGRGRPLPARLIRKLCGATNAVLLTASGAVAIVRTRSRAAAGIERPAGHPGSGGSPPQEPRFHGCSANTEPVGLTNNRVAWGQLLAGRGAE